MRKGFSIMELLAVVVIVGVLLVPISQLTITITRDIPRSFRDSNVNTSLLHALGYMRADINKCVSLSESSDDILTGYKMILIQLPDELICYKHDGDKLIKYRLIDAERHNWEQDWVWMIPRIVTDWKLLQDGDETYAVAVRTHLAQRNGSVIEKKLANSYMFFVGSSPEPVK